MVKLTKRTVNAAKVGDKDYFIWNDELPGFGLRVFASGKRSYLVQYCAGGRSRRYTIGLHGVWTVETARQEAKVQLDRIAYGDNPAEERQLDHKALTIKELCALYIADLNAGLKRIAKDLTANANSDLIEHAYRMGYLYGEKEYTFLKQTMRKRNLSAAQIA